MKRSNWAFGPQHWLFGNPYRPSVVGRLQRWVRLPGAGYKHVIFSQLKTKQNKTEKKKINKKNLRPLFVLI